MTEKSGRWRGRIIGRDRSCAKSEQHHRRMDSQELHDVMNEMKGGEK